MDPSLLDDIILRLLDVRNHSVGKQVQLSEAESRQLCVASREIFLSQPCLLELDASVKIAGDIHGQYSDLLRLFEYGGFPPTFNYLFLGNYVDYGKQGLETIWLLLAYKIKYPENFFLLRGNHECASINRIYGFYDECKRRFNVRLWKVFTDCFNCMPVAALVDDKIFCVHGGLSPDLHNLDQIRNIARPTDVPDNGLLCDLLWSDPSRDVRGWGMNDRGVSYTFGPDKVIEFLEKHDLDLICRSNQVVEDGYEFFADRQLVTVFSAPNYRGEYDNAGAFMSIDENLMCSFQILRPADYRPRFTGIRASTIYSESSSSGLNLSHDKMAKKFEDLDTKKPAERAKKSHVGSNTSTNKSESSSGLIPSFSSIAAKYRRSKSPGFKKLGESKNKQNSGSLNVTSSESPSGIEPPPKVVYDPTSLYRSKSPGFKNLGEMKNKQNSGSSDATRSESPPEIKPPPKIVFDPTNLYRSKSPGVKRFLGARV